MKLGLKLKKVNHIQFKETSMIVPSNRSCAKVLKESHLNQYSKLDIQYFNPSMSATPPH